MTIKDFDLYIRKIIPFEPSSKLDNAINGLQVGDFSKNIKSIALSTDSSMEVLEEAVGSDLLFVHHGFFWGSMSNSNPFNNGAITGLLYKKVEFLIKNNISLYALHLPLDSSLELGHSAMILKDLGASKIEPFGFYKSATTGAIAEFSNPLNIDFITSKLFDSKFLSYLDFGPKDIKKIAVVSGGGYFAINEAIEKKVDLFITGDASHQIYSDAKEAGINVLFAGHYATETFGIKAVRDRLAADFNDMKLKYIDIKTGL